jgi:hypothetical protein
VCIVVFITGDIVFIVVFIAGDVVFIVVFMGVNNITRTSLMNISQTNLDLTE